jgi:hypothetical protein
LTPRKPLTVAPMSDRSDPRRLIATPPDRSACRRTRRKPEVVCSPILFHGQQLSQFASRDSLLVGRNFPVTAFRETSRVGSRNGLGPENLAPPGRQFRANSLYFPCSSGILSPVTGSRSTACSAILSADAETSRVDPDLARENPAIPRGFGRSASRNRTGDDGFGAQ